MHGHYVSLNIDLSIRYLTFDLYPEGSTLILYNTCSTEKLYNREVRIIVADYTRGQEVYPQIAEQLQDLDIGILSGCTVITLYYLYM